MHVLKRLIYSYQKHMWWRTGAPEIWCNRRAQSLTLAYLKMQPVSSKRAYLRECSTHVPLKHSMCRWSSLNAFLDGTPSKSLLFILPSRYTEQRCYPTLSLLSYLGKPLGYLALVLRYITSYVTDYDMAGWSGSPCWCTLFPCSCCSMESYQERLSITRYWALCAHRTIVNNNQYIDLTCW